MKPVLQVRVPIAVVISVRIAGLTADAVADAEQDGGQDAPPTSTYEASIEDFSRDQTIFGAGNAQRPVGADIPHSGTTDAPDGEIASVLTYQLVVTW